MRFSDLPEGSCVRFEYEREPGIWQPRIGIIEGFRYLPDQPLHEETMKRRPDLRRSTHLARIYDLARAESRHFYDCRVRHFQCVDLRPLMAVARRGLQSVAV